MSQVSSSFRRNTSVEEYRDCIPSEDLLKMPDLWLEADPFYVSTHQLANANWCCVIISQAKKKGGFYSRSYCANTRIVFTPHHRLYAGNKHSVIRLKLPVYATSRSEVWTHLVSNPDHIGQTFHPVALGINFLKVNRAEPDERKEDALAYIVKNMPLEEVLRAYNIQMEKSAPKKRKPTLPPIDNVVDISQFRDPKPEPSISQENLDEFLRKLG